MSMTVLTILQVSVIFIFYTGLTCLLPLLIVKRLVPGLRLSEKFLLSVVSGNFYIVNEVLLLQLLHISNRFTLLAGLVIPFLVAAVRLYGISPAAQARACAHTAGRLFTGTLGIKSLVLGWLRKAGKGLRRTLERFGEYASGHALHLILFAGVSALVLWSYLPNLLEHYGYKAFDVPVHNYWINALGKGELFVEGVYPFGFHCVIYYLHAVFGIETYVLLRVFSLVQTIFIYWALLFFLKAALQSGYLAYLGTAVFAASDLFDLNTYYRYNATLPQEFGMIFILPAIYFGFAYFKTRKKWWLAGFAMSFSLTLAVHFYGTMIAGLFCVAMALGFFFRFFRKKYFWPIVGTCFLSVAIAVAPMAIAYAQGTPLQGSLGWGLNILNGANEEESETEEAGQTEPVFSSEEETETGETSESDFAITGGTEVAGTGDAGELADPKTESAISRLKQKTEAVVEKISQAIWEYVSQWDNVWFLRSIYGSMGLCVLLAILYLLLREADLAGRLLTVSCFMVFMCMLQTASELGLPTLMDAGRTSIYYAYMLPVLWCFSLDGLLYLPARLVHRNRLYRGATLAVLVAAVVWAEANHLVREPYSELALETNDAITCLTNIRNDHADQTWTICSANDEYRMVEDYSYHYETITFLRAIENIGRFAGVTIPTQYTYFFIEKVPIEYYETYEGQGQSISEEGAMRELPAGSGIEPYEGESRWIVMSRMYYWAETFMEMYPENMTVYYESDTFICYQLEQNIDHLFELGIDYGYNNVYY